MTKASSRGSARRKWRTIKIRDDTFMRLHEVTGLMSWAGWGNIPEPWRDVWSDLSDPKPCFDKVIRVALTAMQKAIAKDQMP